MRDRSSQPHSIAGNSVSDSTKRRMGSGCRIDGGQAEYVRVPFADQGLNKIPDEVTDRQALFVGDVRYSGLLGNSYL